MEKVDLIYKLNGDFENGIDVFELAPVLLSLGSLISESQNTLYPDKQPLAVNVRPFKEGSFDIQIILHPVSNIQHILDIIRSPGGSEIKELLQYIGLIIPPVATAGAVGVSLIKLIKWLSKFEETCILGQPVKTRPHLPSVKEGQTVADIGAGSGYLTVKLSEHVGVTETIYAVDIQQEMLDYISKRSAEKGMKNVTLVLGTMDDPKLPPNSLYLAILLSTYHEIAQPIDFMKKIKLTLKPTFLLPYQYFLIFSPEQ